MMSDSFAIRFVRHAGKEGPLSKEAMQTELRDGERPGVAIQFDNEPSFDDKKYDSQQYQIRYLNEAAAEPTLFVASFTHYPKREKYIGRSNGTREILVFDMNEDEIVDRAEVSSSKGEVATFKDQYPDERYKFVKFVGVNGWKQVAQESHRPLWHWHSVQTIHGPSSNADVKRKYIRASFFDEPTPRQFEVLSSDDHELMAEHWLRSKLSEFSLDAPRGGTMEAIDILGSAQKEGELVPIYASVTNSTGGYESSRVEAINSYPQHADRYFIGGGSKPDGLSSEVTFVSLREVFELMDGDGGRLRHTLDVMLGETTDTVHRER
ncbi:hypothetical protein [Halobacterium salinarum]|uniref:hypothetical protein n=1 Tax=Halobacterium salinarum TaxID=2242 RepID=UPI002555A1B7|nr:hypothetical protein [Halobacterium salinarum]MDL0122391.1 hypothetical protein [Halobacterium salinarum]